MRVSREQHIQNEIESFSARMHDAMLTAAIQDRKITKLDFTGTDLRLTVENGRTYIFSAMVNDKGKVVIEVAFSPMPEPKKQGVDKA
jgi:hypothetical protein